MLKISIPAKSRGHFTTFSNMYCEFFRKNKLFILLMVTLCKNLCKNVILRVHVFVFLQILSTVVTKIT